MTWLDRIQGIEALEDTEFDPALVAAFQAAAPGAARYPDFAALIEAGEDTELSAALRRSETIGRPLGSAAFLADLERQTGRALRAAKPGPKPRKTDAQSMRNGNN